MKILIATQGSQGVVAIRELFAANFTPENIHVSVCDDGVNGPLMEFIRYNKMSFSHHQSGSHFTEWLINRKQKYDVLLSISWKYLFCEKVIKMFAGKAINFHPGILPNYRGCFSTPWSIINQEKYVGFTYHYVSKNFDEGNIIFQDKIKIGDHDTAHSLNYRIFQLGLSRLAESIGLIRKEGETQSSGGHYYPNLLPFNGKIDKEWSVKQANTFKRAMYFPPYETRLELFDESIKKKGNNNFE